MNAYSPITGNPIDPVDIYVGASIRLARKQLGFSQTALADAIHVTFQQVQKYERGYNRASASRLHAMACVLGKPISFFFPASPQGDGAIEDPDRDLREALNDRVLRDLVREALAVRKDDRDLLLKMARSMKRAA